MQQSVPTTTADPGWPPAGHVPSAAVGAGARNPAKRMRDTAPTAEPAQKDLTHAEVVIMVHKLMAQRDHDQSNWKDVIVAVNDHAGRLDKLEHEDLQWNDRIHMVAEHCEALTKDTDANLRGQMDEFAKESVRCINTLETGIIKTLQGQQEGFDKVLKDSEVLIKQIDVKLIEI